MKGEWLRPPPAGTSVVFVHGILSDGDTCWQHTNGSYWPELMKESESIGSLGIYIFTYETGVFSGSYSLSDAVDALKEFLKIDGVLQQDNIIFVCHSMGGIVVRRFLVERAAELADANKEIGLFLVASPSLGSVYADWLAPLARLMGHTQANALGFASHNPWISELDKEFINLKESGKIRIRGKEIIEDKSIVLSKFLQRQVVQPVSGARYFGDPFKIPESDHFSIAKPLNSGAIQHRLLVQFVESIIARNSQPKAPPSIQLGIKALHNDLDAFNYAPTMAKIRFTITNTGDDTIKINSLRLIVVSKEKIDIFRIAQVGAPHIEFELIADISEANNIDLLESAHAQFVIKGGDSDAFSVTVFGREGTRYYVKIECLAESFVKDEVALHSSTLIRITYPIRTLQGLRHGA